MRVPWVWNQDLTTVTLEMPEWASISPVPSLSHPDERGKWGLRVGGGLTVPGMQSSVPVCLFAPVRMPVL